MVLISAVAAMVYLSSIVLPFMHDFCPYETALSKLLRPWARAWLVPKETTPPSERSSVDAPKDDLTSRVLSWLISNCENPKAVDVVLQSIADTDRNFPCGPLLECSPIRMIIQRIHDCFSAYQLLMEKDIIRLGEMSPENYSSAVIYARSLSVLVSHPEIHSEVYDGNLQAVSDNFYQLQKFYNW